MTADYAHTRHANENRQAKAEALAGEARRRGVPVAGLNLGGGRRRDVRLALGFPSVSEETWHLVVSMLAQDPPPPPAPVRGCRCGGPGPTRLYLAGFLGPCCAPPAPPTPPAGTTLVELRSARGIAPEGFSPPKTTLIDDRAIASGKRRAHRSAIAGARAAEAARRRG